MVGHHDRFSLMDQIPLGICVLRSDYEVMFWNRYLEEWTEISRNQIEGRSICEFFSHFSQSLYANRLAPIFTGGPPTIFSSQLHKHLIPASFSDGRKRIQHTTVTAIPASEGEGFYAMLSIQDVTDLTFRVQEYRQMRDRAVAEAEERRLAQERAEMANRVKDEFLAIVSHELRTPLNPILGWSKLLLDGRLSETTSQRALETIARNATLQAQLIDDLLDVSRILRGKLNLQWQTVDLAFVIHAALDTVRLMAENKAVTLYFEHDVSTAIRGDVTRLQQVVWNLLTNAIKFTPEGGHIDIFLRSEKQQIVLSVQDTGQGIAPDFLPYVFESFRQADASTTRRIGGLGLGLAITRHLVELHGGKIEVQSSGTGQGAIFTVKLPTAQSQFQSYLRSDAQNYDSQNHSECRNDSAQDDLPNLTGIRILVVDDEQDARDLLQFVLENCGAIVTTVQSADEAIAALDDHPLDLIVSDLGMPDTDGFDLIQLIRSRTDGLGKIPAIAVTAYTSELTQQQTILAGFQRHLVKPLNPYELVQAASQLVVRLF